MIACGHCGGRHASVGEVRACSGDAAPPVEPHRSVVDDVRSDAGPAGCDDVVLMPHWEHLAGPDSLARSVVVRPGQIAPSPWSEAPRVTVDGGPEAIEKLRLARRERERLVLELDTALPPADPVLDVDYWHLSPDTELDGEVLRHLVFAHAVDARDPNAPTIAAVSRAVRAGATVRARGPGDVDTPSGPAWCDGGPLDWFDAAGLGAGVLPAVHLRRGNLGLLGGGEPAAELAPDQLAAVAHGGGGARIIAPAGSGKTRVLTERARHLVRDRKLDPGGICLVAFNVRARREMQERLTDVERLEIRTLNSLALAILRGTPPFIRPRGRAAPEVIDERGVRRLLDELVTRRRRAMADPLAAWIEALTATRLGLRSPAVVESEFGGDVGDFAAVVPRFRARLAQAAAVDFDEQILGAIEVLCRDPRARAAARQACSVLLVDEFQDLTPAHVLLLRLLAGPEAEVFGVGDDDQTIYGYAGASPEWLIDFEELFAGSGRHDLEVNYRCAPEVVAAASTLLAHNHRRLAKTIRPAPDRPPGPDALRVVGDDDPLTATVARVGELLSAGVAHHDIAVLTRVNATLLGPMLALAEAGVPTTAPLGPAFLERTGVAGVLAWLRVAVAPSRALPGSDLTLSARRPPRGISGRLAEWIGEQRDIPGLERLAARLREDRDRDKVLDFAAHVTLLRDLADGGATTAELLASIRDEVGLGRALDRRLDASRRSVDRSAHSDDLAALVAVAPHRPDPREYLEWLPRRLSDPSVDPDGVRLSTIHRVKGREWPHVILHEASAPLLPHRLASDREEERRVFHVALTRGSETVTVVAGPAPSPFVADLSRAPEPAPAGATTGRGPARSRAAAPLVSAQARERLREWRLTTARNAGVPAYVVINDATLHEIADRLPATSAELLTVPGIGPVKLERHGDEILRIVARLSDDSAE